MGYDDTEVLDRGLVEKTFLGFKVQVKFDKAMEDFMGKFIERGKIVIKEEDIIQVNDEVTLVDKVLKDMGHKRLKCGWGVAEAEGHDKGFEETELALEGGFPFITLFDADVIVTPTDVEFCKVMGRLEFVDEFRDEWEWEIIFDSDIVEFMVVLNRA